MNLVKVCEVTVDGQKEAIPVFAPADIAERHRLIALAPSSQAVIEALVGAGLYSGHVPYRLAGNRHVFLDEPVPPAVGPVLQEHPGGQVTVWRQ